MINVELNKEKIHNLAWSLRRDAIDARDGLYCPVLDKSLDGAANTLEQLYGTIEKLQAENKSLRNELCLKCGQYREAHNGACNGCRWRSKE